MRHKDLIFCLLFAAVWLGTGEFVGAGIAEARPLSFARDLWPVVRTHCQRCHRPRSGQAQGAGGLNLKSAAVAYRNLVNVSSKQAKGYKLVTPGDPARSYVYYKVVGNHKDRHVGGKGTRCPKRRALPVRQINRIVKWIQQGAKK